MNEIKSYVEKYQALLSLKSSISYAEAEKRAAEFLVALATVADLRHTFTEEKIKLQSIQTATYAEEMSKGTAKTVTENKLTAEASLEYTKSREDLERIDNDIAYLKAHQELFLNGHLFYRQLSKEGQQ